MIEMLLHMYKYYFWKKLSPGGGGGMEKGKRTTGESENHD